MENEQISWEAPEYTHREKNRDWFISFGLIALSLFIVALLFKNVLFSIIIVLIVFTVILYSRRTPEMLSFEVNRVGITVNKTFYPYSYLYSFWVDMTEPHNQKLFITSKKMLVPMIIIPLGEQDGDEVRNFLANYLPEQELMEPLSHKILEYFGF